MRVLIVIPHFHKYNPNSEYGSGQAQCEERVRCLRAAIIALQVHFSGRQAVLMLEGRRVARGNEATARSVDIAVCTTGSNHVIDRLDLPPEYFRHVPIESDPRLLGFAGHKVLQENLDRYDVFGYMEDDLVIHDPWFFEKTLWFAQTSQDRAVLQPNRYETALAGPVRKLYIDVDLSPHLTARYQNLAERPEVKTRVFGQELLLRRHSNPHAGCFFLTATQMRHWAAQPFFLDRDCSFAGPLESAASLGLMRTFLVYKPDWRNADFLELEHAGTRVLNQRVHVHDDGSWSGRI